MSTREDFTMDAVELGTGDTVLATIQAGEVLTIQNIHISNRNAAIKKVTITESTTTAKDLTKHLIPDMNVPLRDVIELSSGMKVGNSGAIRYIIGTAEATVSISVKLSGVLRKP